MITNGQIDQCTTILTSSQQYVELHKSFSLTAKEVLHQCYPTAETSMDKGTLNEVSCVRKGRLQLWFLLNLIFVLGGRNLLRQLFHQHSEYPMNKSHIL
jgi:hypothetical protein